MDKKKATFFERDKKNNERTQVSFSPCKALQPIVKGYMIIDCEDGIDLETLPSTSISINYIINGNIRLKQDNGMMADLPKAVAFGIARKNQCFTFSDNTTLLVIVLKEGAASCMIKMHINELFDQFIDLNELFNTEKISSLDDRLGKQKTYQGMIQMMESFLLSVVDCMTVDAVIEEALHRIRKKKGLISVSALAEELHLSKDAFEKKFRRIVGTTPKHYANIVRFRDLIHKSYPHKRLTEIGLDAGYYDQSHFIRYFKSFTGMPPSNFF